MALEEMIRNIMNNIGARIEPLGAPGILDQI